MSAVEQVLEPPLRDLDGMIVRRALPRPTRRAVGPFVFLDQFGPAQVPAGQGLDVRPHPHIGLATITWLFEGEILHRDSLGTVQVIRPGEVNWMTAGRGIVHSERTPPERRTHAHRMSGMQAWVALPKAHEEVEPAFAHYASVPVVHDGGATIRVITGGLAGQRSPVATFSETLYAEVVLAPGGRFVVPADVAERALYLVEGAVSEGGSVFDAGHLCVLRPGVVAEVSSAEGARLMVLGGEPLDGPRHMWWNFVSSSEERIAVAAREWEARGFPEVPGDPERIPLPEAGRPGTVRYP